MKTLSIVFTVLVILLFSVTTAYASVLDEAFVKLIYWILGIAGTSLVSVTLFLLTRMFNRMDAFENKLDSLMVNCAAQHGKVVK